MGTFGATRAEKRNVPKKRWHRRGFSSFVVGSFFLYVLWAVQARRLVFVFPSSLLLSSLNRRRFHPQRSSSGQAVLTGVVPSPPRYVASFFVAHRVQHYSPCSSIFIECMQLAHAFALSAIFLLIITIIPGRYSLYGRKSPRTSMHSVRLEPTEERNSKPPGTPAGSCSAQRSSWKYF